MRAFALHLKDKNARDVPDDVRANNDTTQNRAIDLKALTAVEPGMNAFQWDLRYPGATEVHNLNLEASDDFSDEQFGPTILPGTYTVVLDYGGKSVQQNFAVKLDPRLHPADGNSRHASRSQRKSAGHCRCSRRTDGYAAVEERAAASHRRSARRSMRSSTASCSLTSTRMKATCCMRRDCATISPSCSILDNAFQAPTAAEQATYTDLKTRADTAISQLQTLTQ